MTFAKKQTAGNNATLARIKKEMNGPIYKGALQMMNLVGPDGVRTYLGQFFNDEYRAERVGRMMGDEPASAPEPAAVPAALPAVVITAERVEEMAAATAAEGTTPRATHRFEGKTAEEMTAALIAEERAAEAGREFKGYTIADLRAAFDRLANPTNWKLELGGIVRLTDLDRARAAAEFFAGSPIRVLYMEPAEFGPDRKVAVQGPGYYASVGA